MIRVLYESIRWGIRRAAFNQFCNAFSLKAAVHIIFFFFFFKDTATTEIYTLSLHDALPISRRRREAGARPGGRRRPRPPSGRGVGRRRDRRDVPRVGARADPGPAAGARTAPRVPGLALPGRGAALRGGHRDRCGRGPGRRRCDRRSARLGGPGIIGPLRRARVEHSSCWGIFREVTHSPGRESDDTEILRLTGKQLEARGLQVILKTPDEVNGVDDVPPRFVFLMCERVEALGRLRALETRGVPHVNTPLAVLNTYRERMIEVFAEANVPFIESRVVSTRDRRVETAAPVWVKRADVHNTQDGDVVFAPTADALRAALAGLAARGIARAVLQPDVRGDLVKFYGVGVGAGANGAPPWFRWFYHKEQRLAGHSFDKARLARLVRSAAAALGLEVYGGDAIISPAGAPVLLDVNAWPSFALYRDEAAARIASHLALRFLDPGLL